MRWYYSVSGKAEGPVTVEFLIEQLKAGKFTLVDLVFKEGESAWKTFGEVPEFREVYQAPAPAYIPPPIAVSMPKQEITLDEISIDDFTPTPVLTQTIAPAWSAPERTAADSAPVSNAHPISSFLTNEPEASASEPITVPESVVAREFVKPEEGWPSDWRLSSSWIVLKKRLDGGGYDQDGPFSAEAIIEMIGQGKVEYSQYCWKPGYTRWFRIGNLPEFDRRKRDRENDTVNQIIPIPAIAEALPALTREELLSNVERLRREQRSRNSDQAPAGTTGKNLVETPLDQLAQKQPQPKQAPVPVTVHAQLSPQPVQAQQPRVQAEPTPQAPIARTPVATVAPMHIHAAEVPPHPTDEMTDEMPDFDAQAIAPDVMPSVRAASARANGMKKSFSPKMVRAALAAFVALIVVAGLFQVLTSKHREPASTPPIEHKIKPTGARSKTSEAAPVTAPVPVAVVAPEAPKVASSLEVTPKDLETAPKLEFTTDMAATDKITVKIKAHTGDILTLGSYTKTFEVATGAPPTLDLSKESLPAGAYFIEAQVGSAQTSTQVFIGKKDDVFTRELEHHLKSLSLRQQSERSALYYGAQSLEKLAKDLVTESTTLKAQPLKWRKAFAAWRNQARDAAMPVITFSKSPANEQTYPEEIAAFQAATDKLAVQAKEVDAAITQKREIASAPTPDVATEFSKLREDSAKLSGRPHVAD